MPNLAELPYVPFTVTAAEIEPTRLCVAGGGVPFADNTILTISTHQVLLRFTPADGCFEVLSAILQRERSLSQFPEYVAESNRFFVGIDDSVAARYDGYKRMDLLQSIVYRRQLFP